MGVNVFGISSTWYPRTNPSDGFDVWAISTAERHHQFILDPADDSHDFETTDSCQCMMAQTLNNEDGDRKIALSRDNCQLYLAFLYHFGFSGSMAAEGCLLSIASSFSCNREIESRQHFRRKFGLLVTLFLSRMWMHS